MTSDLITRVAAWADYLDQSCTRDIADAKADPTIKPDDAFRHSLLTRTQSAKYIRDLLAAHQSSDMAKLWQALSDCHKASRDQYRDESQYHWDLFIEVLNIAIDGQPDTAQRALAVAQRVRDDLKRKHPTQQTFTLGGVA